MAVRRLRNGRYIVELQQSGARIFRRLYPGASKADALALEAKLRRDIFTTAKLGISPEVPLGAAIELWLTHVAIHQKDAHGARLRSKAWAKFVEGRTLRQAPEVAKEALSQWSGTQTQSSRAARTINRQATEVAKEALAIWSASGAEQSKDRQNGECFATFSPPLKATTKRLSAGTVNRRLALLKAVCKWSYQQGMIEDNLSGRIRMLREGPGRDLYLSLAQVRLLSAQAPTMSCKAAIMLAAYTGMRASELLALRETSRGALLAVSNTKSGKPRVVPVPLPARPYLRALPLGLSYWQLHSEFCQARKKAGLPHVRFHDLRHTCASWLINSGVDLYTVGRILGHSSPLTTQRYAHLSQASLRRAMARLK